MSLVAEFLQFLMRLHVLGGVIGSTPTPTMLVTLPNAYYNTGAIDVTYMAENGSVIELIGDTTLATAGVDFSSEVQTVRLEDNQESAVITIPTIDVSLYMLSS